MPGPRARHIVLVRFRDDATETERGAFIRAVSTLRDVPYVSAFTAGASVVPSHYPNSSERWDWGFTVDMDEADLGRYAADPAHRAVSADVAHVAERFAILDFVIA